MYRIRSEWLLMEQTAHSRLFRWVVGLTVDDPVWEHSTFSFNQERLIDKGIAQHFLERTVLLVRIIALVSNEHYSVSGTLLDACVLHKSLRPKDPSDDAGDVSDFHGQKRSNGSHASTSDPDARLMRKGKGKEAKLSYLANDRTENRNGLVVGIDVRHANGTGERERVHWRWWTLVDPRWTSRRAMARSTSWVTSSSVGLSRTLPATPRACTVSSMAEQPVARDKR